jgi:hypothetical protein
MYQSIGVYPQIKLKPALYSLFAINPLTTAVYSQIKLKPALYPKLISFYTKRQNKS